MNCSVTAKLNVEPAPWTNDAKHCNDGTKKAKITNFQPSTKCQNRTRTLTPWTSLPSPAAATQTASSSAPSPGSPCSPWSCYRLCTACARSTRGSEGRAGSRVTGTWMIRRSMCRSMWNSQGLRHTRLRIDQGGRGNGRIAGERQLRGGGVRWGVLFGVGGEGSGDEEVWFLHYLCGQSIFVYLGHVIFWDLLVSRGGSR